MEGITTHTGEKIEARHVPNSESRYLKKYVDYQEVDAVAIDEIQFFDKEIVEYCEFLANHGVRVIVAGLDMDYRGEPFPGPMPVLMAKADKLLKLNAVCEICGGSATRSQRFVDGEPAGWHEATLVVGAREEYQARCREHHEIVKPDSKE
jgi:thymidine kinase